MNMKNDVYKVVGTVGELANAIRGVDPSTKLILFAWTYKDARRKKIRCIRSKDRSSGSSLVVEELRWGEEGHAIRIGNYSSEDVVFDNH